MLEWKTGENGWDETTDEGPASGTGAPARPAAEERWQRIPPRRLLVGLSLLAVLGIAIIAVVKWQATRNLSAVRAAVQGTVDREMWALESGNWGLYESLLDPQMPARLRGEQHGDFVRYSGRGRFQAEVTDLALVEPDLAMVEVRIELPDDPAHREARAYRQMGNTWYHTPAPAGNLWLHQVERETANLRFIYHRDDADHLAPLFPALQQVYDQLLTDFHLSPLPDRRELQIVLSVQPAAAASTNPGLRYALSSVSAPPDANQIKRELGRQLTDRVMRQFYDEAGNMAFVLDGIREWEVSQWMQAADPQSEALISRTLDGSSFIPLAIVQPLSPPAHLGTPVADAFTETITDYLVKQRGRQVIGQLVGILEKYDTWPQLIGRGLGMPYRDVDRGWWQFVTQRYATPRKCSPDSMRSDLVWILRVEKYALETGNREVFESLLDPQAPSEWQSQQLGRLLSGRESSSVTTGMPDPEGILEWECKDGAVWAIIAYQENSEAGQYLRDLRFLRLADQRWYLTSPETAFPDPPSSFRTRHLVLHYRKPDADLIPSITPQLDALYEQVVRDLGVDIGRREPAITFLYTLDRGPIFLLAPKPDEISIASPRLFKNIKMFRFLLGLTVATTLLTEVVDVPHVEQMDAVLADPLAFGLAIWEAGQWGENPTWDTTKREGIENALRVEAFPSLSDDSDPMADITIIEYVAASYGRDHLPDLIQAAGNYQGLQEAIPTVLGVDVETFEAGWRAYLEQTYGTPYP